MILGEFIYQNRKYLTLAVLLICALTLLISNSQRIQESFSNAVVSTVTPFLNVSEWGQSIWQSFWLDVERTHQLTAENERLLLENERLRRIEARYNELQTQLELKELIAGLQNELEYESVYATIIGKNPENYYSVIIINVGKKDGVQKNMPVVAFQDNKKAIVGKVISVTTNAARVLPLMDRGSYIGAKLTNHNYTGIIKGLGNKDNLLELEYINRNASVQFGDYVYTSGQGGIFPPHLLIGSVIHTQETLYGAYHLGIKVIPAIDFSRLDTVFVLKYKVLPEVNQLMEEVR